MRMDMNQLLSKAQDNGVVLFLDNNPDEKPNRKCFCAEPKQQTHLSRLHTIMLLASRRTHPQDGSVKM